MTTTDLFDELINKIADNCCKVCQCENGKKMWCACHRKQIKNHISTHYNLKSESILKDEVREGLGKKKEIEPLDEVKTQDDLWRACRNNRHVGYNQAIVDILSALDIMESNETKSKVVRKQKSIL